MKELKNCIPLLRKDGKENKELPIEVNHLLYLIVKPYRSQINKE
jgi:hypothetical protein